jgi:uncharacterized protein
VSVPVESENSSTVQDESDVFPQGSRLAGYLALGFMSGIASALLGIGSGVIIVPVLSGWFGVPIKRAVGISIATVLGIVGVGVISEAIATSNIQWMLALLLALGAQVGVRIGGYIGSKISNNALRWSFVALLSVTALKLAQIVPGGSFGLFTQSEVWSPWVLTVLAVGTLAGALSVLLGIGGGVVVVPGLLFLIDGMAFQAARATSLAMIVPTSLAGTITHARKNNVLWRSVLPIVIPGLFGAVVGVALANILPGAMLRQYIFPIFLAVMVVRLSLKAKKD